MVPVAIVNHAPLPGHLVEPTPVPEWLPDDATNGDLLNYLLDLRHALNRCNADKTALKACREEAVE